MTEQEPNVENGENDAGVTDLDRAKERARTAAEYEHMYAGYRQLRDTRPNATTRDKDIVNAIAECIELAGEYGNITAITDLIEEEAPLYKNQAAQTGTIRNLFEVACAYWHWGQYAKIRGRYELTWYLYNMGVEKARCLLQSPLSSKMLDIFLSALMDTMRLAFTLDKDAERQVLEALHVQVSRMRDNRRKP